MSAMITYGVAHLASGVYSKSVIQIVSIVSAEISAPARGIFPQLLRPMLGLVGCDRFSHFILERVEQEA